MKRVIFFANDFPPIGGAGVQRAYYFAKYLPESGWSPDVITVKDVAFPAKDASSLEQLPEETRVHRTESFELRRLLHLASKLSSSGRETSSSSSQSHPGSRPREIARLIRSGLFVPDDRILWLPFAIARAVSIARNEKVHAIVATAPCYSAGVIGDWTSRILNVPLVLDLRDPWTRDPYSRLLTRGHDWLNRWFERRAISRASRVIVISRRMKEALVQDYPELEGKVQVIPNGYDDREFSRIEPVEIRPGFNLVYVGSLYAHHLSALRGFIEGWKKACRSDETFQREAQLIVVGRVDPEVKQEIEAVPELRTRIVGYVTHDEAVSWLKGADALLLLIKDLDPREHVITIPGKLFEYLAARKPILMLGPPGDAQDLVEMANGRVFSERDHSGIAEAMIEFSGGLRSAIAVEDFTRQFDRRQLSAQLATVLDDVREEPRPGPGSGS